MSVNDFVLKIKDVSDALSSIGSLVDNDDLVAFTLNRLRGDESLSLLLFMLETHYQTLSS